MAQSCEPAEQAVSNFAMGRGRLVPSGSSGADAGLQRLLDAWGQASLAERNAFLWLAAEEIQAAQEGEFQNALTTPQAPGNGPRFQPVESRTERPPAQEGLTSADLAAAEEEASAWLDEEAEQARLWRDDEVAAHAAGIPMPWERMQRSSALRGAHDDAGSGPSR